MAATSGTGTEIDFATSSWVGHCKSLDWGGISRAAFKTTHLLSTAPATTGEFGGHTYGADAMGEPGEITAEIHLDATSALFPPMHTVAEVIRVTFGGSIGASGKLFAQGSGFVTGMSASVEEVESTNPVSGSITIKASGVWTYGTTA